MKGDHCKCGCCLIFLSVFCWINEAKNWEENTVIEEDVNKLEDTTNDFIPLINRCKTNKKNRLTRKVRKIDWILKETWEGKVILKIK